MDRRQFLQTLSAGAAATTLGPWVDQALGQFRGRGGRPNVLFISIDDLKPLLNCYGANHIHSPNIDWLARRGVVFANAQCQQAVSAPSRVSVMTGLYPDSSGVHDLKTRMRDKHPDVVTLPQHFRNHGYITAGVGKTFDSRAVDDGHDTASWSHGYTRFPHDQLNPNHPPPAQGYHAPGTRERVEQVQEIARDVEGKGYWHLFKRVPGSKPPYESMDVPDDAYIDGAICKHGMQRLETFTRGEQPFFLSVGFFKPHLPFVAPKKYWDLYDPEEIDLAAFQELPEGGPRLAHQPGWELRSGYTGIPAGSLPEDLQRKLIHGYYACISYIDAQVGKLLDKLDELDIADSTIVCLWGDHGWHLGDHDMWCKHSNFEQAVRSPLIIAPASGHPGATANGPVGFVDLYPTLCDLAGLPVPEHAQGLSLVPMLTNPGHSVKPVQMSQYPRTHVGGRFMGYTLRDERYRATFWIPLAQLDAADPPAHAEPIELYDYETDPLETVNLAGAPEHAQRMIEFTDHLRETIALGRGWVPESGLWTR